MMSNRNSIRTTDTGQRNSESSPTVQELLRSLVMSLSSNDADIRAAAISRLRNLGVNAKPALPAIAKVIADANEDIANSAFRFVEEFCPQLERYPDLWKRLATVHPAEIRLAATEELVRILPTILFGETSANGEWSDLVTEDVMNSSWEDRLPVVPYEYRGRWIAWDADESNIFAVADTYAEIMELVADVGQPDLVVEKAPGFHPAVAAMSFTLLEDESTNVIDDVRQTIPYPDEWLKTPNTRLWCQKPSDLIGTPQERYLRYLLRGIRSGITS